MEPASKLATLWMVRARFNPNWALKLGCHRLSKSSLDFFKSSLDFFKTRVVFSKSSLLLNEYRHLLNLTTNLGLRTLEGKGPER
jgi:hypothetical protein